MAATQLGTFLSKKRSESLSRSNTCYSMHKLFTSFHWCNSPVLRLPRPLTSHVLTTIMNVWLWYVWMQLKRLPSFRVRDRHTGYNNNTIWSRSANFLKINQWVFLMSLSRMYVFLCLALLGHVLPGKELKSRRPLSFYCPQLLRAYFPTLELLRL